MSGVEIVPGVENQVFDDLSDVDRAAGDVSIRKVYAAVGSADAGNQRGADSGDERDQRPWQAGVRTNYPGQ